MVRLSSDSDPGSEPAQELPMAGGRRERGDAAVNRRRILAAARKLLTDQGAPGLTMEAVATAAGVGKGTVFRRFGDRDGLTHALLDDYMSDFQDAFLHGPPPLGPGAPAAKRLEAFVVELLRRQGEHLEFALAAERRPGRAQPAVYGVLAVHVAALVHEIDASIDARILAGFILSAISPPVLHRMRRQLGVDTAALEASARALLRGLTDRHADDHAPTVFPDGPGPVSPAASGAPV